MEENATKRPNFLRTNRRMLISRPNMMRQTFRRNRRRPISKPNMRKQTLRRNRRRFDLVNPNSNEPCGLRIKRKDSNWNF